MVCYINKINMEEILKKNLLIFPKGYRNGLDRN